MIFSMGSSSVFFCCDSTSRVYLTGRLHHSFFCLLVFTNSLWSPNFWYIL